MAESRFGLCIPIAVAETRPSVVRGGVGATRLRLRRVEGRQACPFGRRVGDSADRWRRSHTTADRDAPRYGRA
jgi:hypothetical protein